MLGGGVVCVLGFIAATHGEKTIGYALLVIGAVAWFSFRYPRQWEKTWPDDFPRLARFVGVEPRPERWAPTPKFWETAPAESRLRRSVLMLVLGLALLGWGLTNPLDWHGYPSKSGGVLIGALVVDMGVRQLRRAARDRSR